MLQQQQQQIINDMDFDTYFNVTTNISQPLQQPQQQESTYDQIQLLQNRPIRPTQQYHLSQQLPQQQQPATTTFEMMDWCFKQQKQQQYATYATIQTPGAANNYALASSEYFYPPNTTSLENPCRFSMDSMQNHSSPKIKEEDMTASSVSVSDIILPDVSKSSSPITCSPTSFSNMSPLFKDTTNSLTEACASSDDEIKMIKGKKVKPPSCSKSKNIYDTHHGKKANRNNSSTNNSTSDMIAAAMAAVATRSKQGKPTMEPVSQIKKVAHNAIERRYRNNINDRIDDLKNVVPALYKAKIREKKNRKKSSHQEEDSDSSDEEQENSNDEYSPENEVVDGVLVAKKLNKATILLKATEYIHHLKHTNELAERENQVLQQILAQMPGGSQVLAQYQAHKNDLQQQEQERMMVERKESIEREKAERQRILRERAAQRAALAEMIPKTERRPYRRRAKKEAESMAASALAYNLQD